jgi:hypothetical protein
MGTKLWQGSLKERRQLEDLSTWEDNVEMDGRQTGYDWRVQTRSFGKSVCIFITETMSTDTWLISISTQHKRLYFNILEGCHTYKTKKSMLLPTDTYDNYTNM